MAPTGHRHDFERATRWLLAAPLLLALGARLYGLAAQPLWLDEAVTARVSLLPLAQAALSDSGHPPLYHVLMHPWVRVFGDGEAALRGFSALCSIATVPVVYAIGRQLAGPSLGLLAAALFALAPFQVRYAQEARMYALFALTASVAIWGLVTLVYRPSLGRGWLLYVAGATLAVWTQYLAVLFVIAANAGAVLLMAVGAIERRSFLRPWFLAQAAVVLLWLPVAPLFWAMSIRVSGGFWIPQLSLARAGETARAVFLAAYADPASCFLGPALLAAALAGAWAWRHRPRALILCGSLLVVPWVAEAAVSLVAPILLDRTLIWTAIPFQMLVSAGVLGLRPRRLRVLAVAAVLAIGAVDLHAYHTEARKPPWDEVADYVATRAEDDDLTVFVAGWIDQPFEYYLHRVRAPIAKVEAYASRIDDAAVSMIIERSAEHARVWLIQARGHAQIQDPENRVRAALLASCKQHSLAQFSGIDVVLFADCRQRCPATSSTP